MSSLEDYIGEQNKKPGFQQLHFFIHTPAFQSHWTLSTRQIPLKLYSA